jgi:hypothetical protein
MALDNINELNQPTKSKLGIFQTITLVLEIALFALLLIGFLFKIQSFPYASEMIILSILSISGIYLLLPILLFKSQKIGGHLLSHFAGLILPIALIGALFKIESWPYAQEMVIMAQLVLPVLVVLLCLLAAINFKEKQRLYLYLRIGLRVLVLILLFKIY